MFCTSGPSHTHLIELVELPTLDSSNVASGGEPIDDRDDRSHEVCDAAADDHAVTYEVYELL